MFILAFVSISAYAQSLTVTGKVIDSEGYEVIGGSVTVKGAAGVGTVTDVNGNYSLKVNDASKDVLVFSYVGMTSQEVKVNGKNVINVTLKADAVLLDEVVAIGYATVKRKDLTGSVASVGNQEIAKVPVSDVTQALSGRMAGVQVQQTEGAPGSSVSIRIRGGISITQSNEPLYVIDGFPSEDGMSTLDPAEIETIDVLKDASATAIYGARGANGVVVITTKNGSKSGGKATVTFDSYVGFKKIAKKLDVLSPYEFALLDYERTLYKIGKGDGGDLNKWKSIYGDYSDLEANYAGRKGINWQDETLGRTALTQNYRVGVSGNTEKMQYSLAYAYYDEEGAMMYSGSKKHNISFNMNHEVNKWLSVNARISYDQMRVEGMGTSEGGDRFNKMQHILQYRPTIGINGVDTDLLGDEDPLFADDSGNVMQNPLLSAAEETKDREWRTFQANAGATIKLLKGLTFRNTTGMRYHNHRNGQIASLAWAWDHGRVFQTAALFLFGLLIGRRGLFLKENLKFWNKVLCGALIAFFPLYGLGNMLPDFIANKSILSPLLLIITSLSKFAFMLVLVSGVIFAFYRTNLHDWLMKITPYGKMSLTNYITQSIIGSLLFYNWGLALHSQLGITASFLVGVVLFIVQLAFCRWWMSRHAHGPLDRKSTRLNSSHIPLSRMPSSA